MGNAGNSRIIAYLVTRLLLELVLLILLIEYKNLLLSRTRDGLDSRNVRLRPTPSPPQPQRREENSTAQRRHPCPVELISQAVNTSTSREERVNVEPSPVEQPTDEIVEMTDL